ncbi:MAG TPA: ABC transporter ATP-binding protein [bacterium]|nr:ABC transporter ATP-binding protein [bacterium]
MMELHAPGAPMIEIEHVRKAYRGRPALHDLSLHIPEGRIFGLLGPNGAGKTTLLRLIMGVLQPDAGRIRLFDGLAPGSPAATRQIGYMPQQLALYEGLTVRENVRFFGHMYGLDGAVLDARTTEVLERVELSERQESLSGTLSGGMMRRAMLASALVHQPRLLILDEPTAGVDPLLRLRFWDWFRRLASEGITLLVTTHHISEASRGDEVLFLREGSILEQGRPDELIRRYGAADLEAAFVQATRRAVPGDDASRTANGDPGGGDPPGGNPSTGQVPSGGVPA